MTPSSIFILGQSRCASKFYMNFLNSNEDINISPELNFKGKFKIIFIVNINE